MKMKYAIPGFTKGKYYCSLQETRNGTHAECKMAIKERWGPFIKWGGAPNCKVCDIVVDYK